jgi:hypothetical protein
VTTVERLPTSIATVGFSGTLPDKREAAAAGFDGVQIFENDLLASARAAAELREMAERAAACGMRMCDEALAWGRHVSLWRQAWGIVQRADHPSLGLCLESFHTLSRDDDVAGLADAVPGGKAFFLQRADAPRLAMDVLSWSRHHRLAARPAVPQLSGVEFVACAVDRAAGEVCGAMLGALGFSRAGPHRSKDVALWRSGAAAFSTTVTRRAASSATSTRRPSARASPSRSSSARAAPPASGQPMPPCAWLRSDGRCGVARAPSDRMESSDRVSCSGIPRLSSSLGNAWARRAGRLRGAVPRDRALLWSRPGRTGAGPTRRPGGGRHFTPRLVSAMVRRLAVRGPDRECLSTPPVPPMAATACCSSGLPARGSPISCCG